MSDRKQILVSSEYIEIDDLFSDRTIEQVLQDIQSIYNKHEEDIVCFGYDVKFQMDWGYDSVDLKLVTRREETDEEYEARMVANKKAAERKAAARMKKLASADEATERALYETLKKKYG